MPATISSSQGLRLKISKKNLVGLLDKINNVANRGVRSEFDFSGNVTIEVTATKVNFITTNGHLDAQWSISPSFDKNIGDNAPGRVSVDVDILRKICKSLGGIDSDDHIFSVENKNKKLFITDLTGTNTSKDKKKQASMETLSRTHEGLSFSIPKGSPTIVDFETPMLQKGMSSVRKYISNEDYKVRYKMVCIRLQPNSVDIVAGSGKRFGIFSFKPDIPNDVPEEPKNVSIKDATLYLIPANQVEILSSILNENKKTTIHFKRKTLYYIENDNLRVVLKGIPNEEYIDYWRFSDRSDEAVCIVDIMRTDLLEATSLIGAVKDKDISDQGLQHSCTCKYKEGEEAEFSVDEGRYRADITVPCYFYNIKDTAEYSDEYSWEFLNDISHCGDREYARFICLPDKIILADMVNLTNEKDNNGLRIVNPNEDKSTFRFFFASMTNK